MSQRMVEYKLQESSVNAALDVRELHYCLTFQATCLVLALLCGRKSLWRQIQKAIVRLSGTGFIHGSALCVTPHA